MTLLLNNADVAAVLTPALTRSVLMTSYRDLAAGEAVCRPRIDIRIPTKTPGRVYQWGTMEGGSSSGYFAIRFKSDVLFEQDENGVRTEEKFASRPGLFCGMILLTDIETAVPLALINDGYLQHMRVAADSAIGASMMARQGSITLGMLGSGGMARSHVESLREVRDIRRIQVYSPTVEHCRRFAAEMIERFGIETVVHDHPRDVYRGADILAACTDSAVPVINGEWLEPGMHVISIGGRPNEAARARFDVTLRLGTSPAPVGRPELGTADEYLGYVARPSDPVWKNIRAGRKAPVVTGYAEDVMMADIVQGRTKGRTGDEQVTYSERGNIQGAQFYGVAGAVYEAARDRKIGHTIPTEWFLQDIRD